MDPRSGLHVVTEKEIPSLSLLEIEPHSGRRRPVQPLKRPVDGYNREAEIGHSLA